MSNPVGGRPTKLTKELQQRVTQAIRVGMTYERACTVAGICFQTYRNWQLRGERDKSGIYFEFLEAVKKAEAEAELMHLGAIVKASKGGDEVREVRRTMVDGQLVNEIISIRPAAPQWQAAAWLLERRYPERYRRRDDAASSSSVPPKITLTWTGKSDEEEANEG